MGKDQDLLEACRTGNITAIEKLLAGRLGSKAKGSKGTGGGALSSLSKSFLSLKSANVNCVDGSGDTPLHLAALNGHKEIVTILLECDASPSMLDSRDCSPLHLAAWNGHTDICSHLLLSQEGQSLINLQTRDGNTALHFAAQHGHDSTLSLLLQKKGDPTIRNLEDFSPLDLAALYDRLDIVKQLVTSHPALLAQRSTQHTPLHLASRNGHRAVVQYLLLAGFPINARTDKGSALHEAANSCKLEVIKLLLERGVDICIKSETGCTAEDILRSIPSKAAEDALNILKTHIYHQRTPDSDGEKSIMGDIEEANKAVPPPPPVRSSSVPQSVQPDHLIPKKPSLQMSLPSSSDTPPPIPPRQSLTAGMVHGPPPGIPPPSVPGEKSMEGDEDRKASNASPRDSSPRDVNSPASKSPLEMPKKPPRKKPNSFRKPEAMTSLPPMEDGSETPPVGRSNYFNLDPLAAKMEMDSKRSVDQGNDSIVVPVTMVTKGDSQLVERVKSVEAIQPCTPQRASNATCDESEDSSRVFMTPPQSLDIDKSNGSSVNQTDLPTSPSKIRQPPTPDCPPPSPSTAIQDIQRKIQPMEKRRSQDVETLTDRAVDNNCDGVGSEPQPKTLLDPANIPGILGAKILTPVSEEGVHLAGGMPLPPPPPPPTEEDTSYGQNEQESNPKFPSPPPPIQASPPIQPPPPSPNMSEKHPPPKVAPKPKPQPLPRKSSLSAQSVDLYPTQVDDRNQISHNNNNNENHTNNNNHPEGYGGARPMISSASNQGRVLKKQDQVGAGSHEESLTAMANDVSNSTAVMDRRSRETSRSSSNVMEVMGEQVEMRRSMSTGNDPEWQGHVFADLLRGSVVGGARDVVHQLCGNKDVSVASLRKKRKSTARRSLGTFGPVMEEDKDLNSDQLLADIDNIDLGQKIGEVEKNISNEEDVFDDDSEEWAQINATFEAFGVGLSRESVFVAKHLENFTKYISEGKEKEISDTSGESKLQSVGEWLQDIGLPQYENTLVANGFDDTDFLDGRVMEEQDLCAIGVEDSTHRTLILEGASKLLALQPLVLDKLPESVAEWLGSLRLDHYLDTFMSHGYSTMDRVVQLWELELVTVLDITSVGHRKRILASLGERRPETCSNPAKPRVASFEGFNEPKSPFDNVDLYRDYTGVRSRVNRDQDPDLPQGSVDEFEAKNHGVTQGQSIRDQAIHIRAPHMMQYTGSIKQWRHKPEILIKGCCNYTAHYLGSTLVKELKGAVSTQEGIAKLKKSSEVISKIPSIMLSISFKGVKFIDSVSKRVVCDHEIANIFCACQDAEHMNFFAYITKDREAGKHYCHVFSVRSRELAGEIILTLGEAFEIAYQMVLKEKAEAEAANFENKTSSVSDNGAGGSGSSGSGRGGSSSGSLSSLPSNIEIFQNL